MEVQLCGNCGKAVSTLDIEEAGAGEVDGTYYCPGCYASMQAPAAENVLELIDEAPSRPAPASSRRLKAAGTGRHKKLSSRHAPVKNTQTSRTSRRLPAQKSSSQALKKISTRMSKVESAPSASTSQVRRMAAAEGRSTSAKLQTPSGRIQTASGRFQSQSGRYAAPAKKNSAVVVILLLVILGLVGAVVAVIVINKNKARDAAQAAQTTPDLLPPDVTDVTPPPDQVADTVQNPVDGTDTPAVDPDTTVDGDGDIAPDAAAVKAIEDAIDARDAEAAFELAVAAVTKFPDSKAVAKARKQAGAKMVEHCLAVLEEGEGLVRQGAFDDARTLYNSVIEKNIPEATKAAREKLAALDQAITAHGSVENEQKAKEVFLITSVYFNDYMDARAAGSRDSAAPEAQKGFNRLLQEFGTTDFVRGKQQLIQNALKLLAGEDLPAPEIR